MILAVPPQTLTEDQRTLLIEKGYVIIETDDPSKVRVIDPESAAPMNEYFMSALEALSKSGTDSVKSDFVKALFKRLTAIEDNSKH